MHVREHFQIAANEDGVARHPHVQLEILDRLRVRILDAKRKQSSGAWHERAVVAHPNDASAINGIGRGVCGPRAVVAGQRRAL